MRKLLFALLVLAALGSLAWPVAAAVASAKGREMVPIHNVNDSDTVEFKRAFEFESVRETLAPGSSEFRQAVIEIYGQNPRGDVETYVQWDESHVVEPPELPGLVLVEVTDDHYPLQTTWLTLPAKRASQVSLLVFVLAGATWYLTRKKST